MNGQLDGIPIDVRRARLTGTVTLEDDDIGSALADSELVIVGRVRVVGENTKVTKGGDLERTDLLKLLDLRIIDDADTKRLLADGLGFSLEDGGQQRQLDVTSYSGARQIHIDVPVEEPEPVEPEPVGDDLLAQMRQIAEAEEAASAIDEEEDEPAPVETFGSVYGDKAPEWAQDGPTGGIARSPEDGPDPQADAEYRGFLSGDGMYREM